MNDQLSHIALILEELERAKALHPKFPLDVIHQVAIMNEEAGEAIRAALNWSYHGEDVEHLKTELIQTAAMCLRCLEHIG